MILNFIIRFHSEYLHADGRIRVEMDPRHVAMRVYGMKQPDAAYGQV
jgi:hypothetical protein